MRKKWKRWMAGALCVPFFCMMWPCDISAAEKYPISDSELSEKSEENSSEEVVLGETEEKVPENKQPGEMEEAISDETEIQETGNQSAEETDVVPDVDDLQEIPQTEQYSETEEQQEIQTLETRSVEIWERTDIVLNSENTYENPYQDVLVDAVFTHEDGTEIKLSGFWNGDNEWRVRFAPTKTGIWNYVVTSDQKDAGLNAAGTIQAVENTGDTGIDRHGFVQLSENNRYFTYADGTPFYWLGDTNWQAPNYVSITQCNYPGCDCGNQFKHEVDDRLKKGSTSYSEMREKCRIEHARLQKEFDLPYYPNVTMGWDSSPRTIQTDVFEDLGYPFFPVYMDNTPEEFKKALIDMKAYLDTVPEGCKMGTINAWNEWTEGSYIEPDTVHGMKYLEAIRDVFGEEQDDM